MKTFALILAVLLPTTRELLFPYSTIYKNSFCGVQLVHARDGECYFRPPKAKSTRLWP